MAQIEGLKEKISKKRHEYDALKRNLMDDLERMAQESEEIIKKVYESVGEIYIDMDEYETEMGHRSWPTEGYEIKIAGHHIYVAPETRTEKREEITQRTGLAKLLFGPEKKKIIEEKVPTGRLIVDYTGESWGGFGYYSGKCKENHEESNLVNIARKIKEDEDESAAKKFAELNKRIRELPTRIVEHIEKRTKELEAARTLGSAKDADKLDYIKTECQHCGAPNPNLEPTCGYCGHKAYEIPKKVKQK